MTKTEYSAYLSSSNWKTKRIQRLEWDKCCQRCSIPRWLAEVAYDQDLHVHHISYARIGNEEMDDLEVLCRRCHDLETFGRSELRAPKEATCGICRELHWNVREKICGSCTRIIDGDGSLSKLIRRFERGSKNLIVDFLQETIVEHKKTCEAVPFVSH